MQAVPFLALAEQARSRVAATTTTPAASRRAQKAETSTSVTLTREGDVWLVSASMTAPFRVKHAKGMEYLDHLLRNPGREVYVLASPAPTKRPRTPAWSSTTGPSKPTGGASRTSKISSPKRSGWAIADVRAARARSSKRWPSSSRPRWGWADATKGGVERRTRARERAAPPQRRHPPHRRARRGAWAYLDATVRTGTYCVYRPV